MKVIIVGGGKVGKYLSALLLSNDQDVKLLVDSEKYTDIAELEKAGISHADVLAVVTDTDEKNLVVSTLAKMEFGVPKVIARVNNPQNAWLYNAEMGVDIAVNQADIMAHLILEEIDLENILTLLKLNRGEYSIIQMNVTQEGKAINKFVKDLDIPEKSVLISLVREGEVLITKGDTQILVNDEILMLTNCESDKELKILFG